MAHSPKVEGTQRVPLGSPGARGAEEPPRLPALLPRPGEPHHSRVALPRGLQKCGWGVYPRGPLVRDPEKLEEKMMQTQRKQGCPKAGMRGPGPWTTLPPAPRPQLRRATASGQAGGLPGLLTWL